VVFFSEGGDREDLARVTDGEHEEKRKGEGVAAPCVHGRKARRAQR